MNGAGTVSGGLGIMRDHDDGLRAVTAEILQDREDVAGGLGVQIASGFIGYNQTRVGDQGAGDGDALFLAAGKLLRQMMAAFAQPNEVEGCCDLLAALTGTEAGEQEGQLHVLKGGENRDQVKGLENEADVLVTPIGEFGFVKLGDVDAIDNTLARGGAINAGNDVEQGGFAGAGRAHEREELATRDFKGDAVQSGDVDLPLPVDFAQLKDLYHRVAAHKWVKQYGRMRPNAITGGFLNAGLMFANEEDERE